MAFSALEKEESKEKPPKKLFSKILILLLLLLVMIGAFFAYQHFAKEDGEVYKDRDAQLGVLPGMSEEEIQQRLNSVIAEGMMNVSMNPNPVFENGTSEGDFRIENIEKNHYSYQVTVTLDDTGEQVYQSGLLDPGYFIEKAKLDVALKKGEYPATARFLAYEKVDEEVDEEAGETVGEDPIGAAVVKIKMTIQN